MRVQSRANLPVADGSVVSWGLASHGGDSSSVASELASGVLSIQPPKPDGFQRGFVAWKAGSTAVIWGHNTDGSHIALPVFSARMLS